ncbi:hypothetical protein [Microbacterium candidum]|uniref:Uncharacterized protein n=1 Tax=Microbacterium candidum TaxID=3041922 RepID=A0ABT7MUT8_9MICO|nr:hypothetical protein [Microbacterium sp. ASV49]MDL9978215.1 hypothetical protein [Microbacterium sp. ASV49]
MAGVLATVLGLAGCASADPAPVRSALEAVPGVQSAQVVVGHPGAPWNTETLITLRIADGSAEPVEAAARAAIAGIAATDVAQHPVRLYFTTDAPAGSQTSFLRVGSDVLKPVARDLGLEEQRAVESLPLSPADIKRLAAEK